MKLNTAYNAVSKITHLTIVCSLFAFLLDKIIIIIIIMIIIIIGIYIAPFPFIKCSKALHIVIV